MKVKYRRNITFLVTWKIVKFYMNGKIYANGAQNVNPISSSNMTTNNNQLDK